MATKFAPNKSPKFLIFSINIEHDEPESSGAKI